MKFSKLIIACAASAIISAASLGADAAPVQTAMTRAGGIDLTEASVILGRCLVQKDRQLAVLLMTLSEGAERRARVRQAGRTLVSCLGGFQSAKLPLYAVRGGVAEALLSEDGKRGFKAVRALPPSPAKPIAEVIVEPAPKRTGLGSGRAYYFACVAAAEPGEAVDVLTAPVGSAAEAAAMEMLRPAFQGCAPSHGELHFASVDLRPMLAVALYARLHGTPIF